MGRSDRKKEHYYREAKRKGYRSRSAFKLKQIARKHRLLKGVDKVLELCSAPGGWTQILRELDNTLEIVAVDLDKMPPIQRVKFIQGDITAPDVVETIRDLTGGSVDLVLSDCSPNVTGNWTLDVARQLELAEATVSIADGLLTTNGKVLAKVFQGKGFQQFLQTVRDRYRSVKLVKPDASRKSSAEIYLLAALPRKQKEREDD
ncbi:MAG: Ribosomal RNA large subunit methyltransferase E [Candidatus Thorarchaeota archaeon]|nr:MAG: Ribosomal RNA large subunit methyltransferase E [Candidatus Thorarchaeota archaeon]